VKLALVGGGGTFPVEVEEEGGRLTMRLDGAPLDCEVLRSALGDGLVSILLDGRSYEARVTLQDREALVEIDGHVFAFEKNAPSPGAAAVRRATTGRADVKAPMPGKIVKLLVAPGDTVAAGQGLLLFEAMKMQNEIRSPLAGRVTDVRVREGQAVESKDLFLTVQA